MISCSAAFIEWHLICVGILEQCKISSNTSSLELWMEHANMPALQYSIASSDGDFPLHPVKQQKHYTEHIFVVCLLFPHAFFYILRSPTTQLYCYLLYRSECCVFLCEFIQLSCMCWGRRGGAFVRPRELVRKT